MQKWCLNKTFVQKFSLSFLSSYDHLEHQYCAWLVSTILWWELYCTCSHFMNFGRTRALKSQALKTISSNQSCLIRKSCFFWNVAQIVFRHTDGAQPAGASQTSFILEQECITTANTALCSKCIVCSCLSRQQLFFSSCAASRCGTPHLFSVCVQTESRKWWSQSAAWGDCWGQRPACVNKMWCSALGPQSHEG